MGATMDLNAAFLRAKLRETLSDPQAAARGLIELNPPVEARWLGLALVAVLSAFMGQVGVLMLAGAQAPLAVGAGASVVVQGVVLVVTVFAVHGVGRMFGGSGAFADALLLVAWLQFLMVGLQALQLVSLLLIPPLSGMIGILSIALFLWVLTNFVSVLHGFASLARVFGMIIVSFLAIAFLVAFVLALLGVQGPGMVDA